VRGISQSLQKKYGIIFHLGYDRFLPYLSSSFACHYHPIMYYIFDNTTSLIGSSVGIATDYGLDGPGSNPGGDEIFRPSRPDLRPIHPSVKWVPGLSRGKVRPGRAADHSHPSSAAVMEE